MTWTKTHNWNNKNVPIGTSTKPKPLLELKLKITKMIIKSSNFPILNITTQTLDWKFMAIDLVNLHNLFSVCIRKW